jgi:hypothetical protein
MAGRIYDSTESKRIEEFLSNQSSELDKVDAEKEIADKKVLRYTILLAGGVLSLILLKVLISRKK